MALTHTDRTNISTLANVSGKAYTPHALSPGYTESSVDAQHTKAIAYWTAIQSGGTLNAGDGAAVADAISHLTALQTYMRDPTHNSQPLFR